MQFQKLPELIKIMPVTALGADGRLHRQIIGPILSVPESEFILLILEI